jgi:hypothetical protein
VEGLCNIRLSSTDVNAARLMPRSSALHRTDLILSRRLRPCYGRNYFLVIALVAGFVGMRAADYTGRREDLFRFLVLP